jgi:hypothetical protein
MYLQALARALKWLVAVNWRSRVKTERTPPYFEEVSVLSDYTTSSYYSQHSYSSQQYTVNMSVRIM